MEIECQGCYYTLCSFVCLTEDLSEILRFLWRHGCLRKSYLCEKCGRKCAIGDKDLFFRCNRNTLPSQEVNGLSSQSNSLALIECQEVQQVQSNGNGQINIHHQINQINHHQYLIPNPSELTQQGRLIVQNANADTFTTVLIHRDARLHEPGLMHTDETCQNNSVNLTAVHNSMLNHNELNQSERILTVIDSQGNRIIHANDQNTELMTGGNQTTHNLQTLQAQQDFPVLSSTSTSDDQKSVKPKNRKDGKVQKKRCNFKVSMKKGTFFEKSKLPIDTVCKFVVFWCCMKHPTQEFLRNELSLATRTVVDWSTACREICIHWAKSVSEKIGGDGVMVQIDEVKIQECKDNKLSDNGNRFSFWGMEKDKEKGKIFIVPVPACDSWSLLTVVNDWILPGSVIISNCWKAYDCLKLQEFIQQTIVQSKTFVHPQNNAGQQNFEGKVDEAGASAGGEMQMPRFGTRRSHHLGDLSEFMFKRRYTNHLERMHAFFKQISLAYPLR